ncbi:MAG TPA: hypothetical protein VGK40_09855 [Verrucomicrobiae bacterium]|jgi:hypothetical protein
MKTTAPSSSREQGGAMVAYLAIALVITAAIAAIAGYVVQNIQFNQRRQDMVNAIQFAQGAAAISVQDVCRAYTNTANSGNFFNNLTTGSTAYTKNTSLSTSSQLVYERTITSPFTNQSVLARIYMTNSISPDSARIVATATFGNSTQSSEVYVEMKFGFPAAILSTAQGDANSGVSKSVAQGGDVVVDGASSGTTKIDGGIISNGASNTNTCAVDNVSEGLYGTGSEIPDYTDPGSTNQLFDFSRFIAAADVMGTHYTNVTTFMAVAKVSTPTVPMEGIIVLDLPKGGSLPSLSPSTLPNGLNVRGTLIFNFTGAWHPLDKIINTATMNINAADLSGLVPGNPATYTSGYPPTFLDSTKNPVNANITSKGYENFKSGDDLPALMYNNAVLDMHGDVNISGVVYSSSFMEIENKQDGQIQYFRGSLIGGGGIYVENSHKSSSIVSYDPNALDKLATSGTRGKVAVPVYRK